MVLRIKFVEGFGVGVFDDNKELAIFFGEPKHSRDPEAIKRAELFIQAMERGTGDPPKSKIKRRMRKGRII